MEIVKMKKVLFQNDSPATLLARVIGIICPIDQDMLAKGRDTHKYFTKNHMLYERNQDTNRLEYLIPKKTSLRHSLPMGDQGFIEFVFHLLEINPKKRPSAAEALKYTSVEICMSSITYIKADQAPKKLEVAQEQACETSYLKITSSCCSRFDFDLKD
ncbi:hypothetical protein CTI12_AA328830 [Artemisia annua]|uniref:Uncharacterized protein n=1 Tax=Artemisia annua TaxID=35608 RepID=A0A2U1MY75_ARTAN|nr:hypothetical protein CTI12_AA328830 [Artemisia annua]